VKKIQEFAQAKAYATAGLLHSFRGSDFRTVNCFPGYNPVPINRELVVYSIGYAVYFTVKTRRFWQ
jgi:hypothetical protein